MAPESKRQHSGSADAQAFIDEMNEKYANLHTHFENNFWSTKMALAGNCTDELTRTKNEMDGFLMSKDNLNKVRDQLKDKLLNESQTKVLRIMEKTLKCYIIEDPAAAKLKEDITAAEGKLEASRATMKLGYVHPSTGEFHKASSVQLRTLMTTDKDEKIRKACYDGMLSIGDFVAPEFVEIVKMRNRLAHKLGFEDFYEYKVTAAEGFGKKTLFTMMDDLQERTHPLMVEARKKLAKQHGESALNPWNTTFSLSGDVTRDQDPFFPFEKAVQAWAESFARMGITYRDSTMNLDLCDREGKYSNGFCHWPQPAYYKSDGTWVPCRTNFTSLATPSAVGSGHTALATLMHEGGHAAHFANIDQDSPFFSQERAPTSVAYAENQSMFLDSLVDDAAWLAVYSRDRAGNVMPWELIERAIRAKHDYLVLPLRSMLAVPYFEKALYEMKEEDVTTESVLKLAREVEDKIQGGRPARPLMSVPHILSDESSCYYHGYVLAEMSVHQTRDYFLSKFDRIVDNPKVGKELCDVYWKPGNSRQFLDLVKELTGSPLTATGWVAALGEETEARVAREHKEYNESLALVNGRTDDPPSLDMRILLVHGDEVISDSKEGGLPAAMDKFKEWVRKEF